MRGFPSAEFSDTTDSEGTVVTVLPDSNKTYLPTALCNAEPPRDGHLSPRVMLGRFTAVRSVDLAEQPSCFSDFTDHCMNFGTLEGTLEVPQPIRLPPTVSQIEGSV